MDKIRRYSDSGTTTKIVLNDEVIKLHGKSKIKKIILEKEKDLSKRINWRKCTIT